MTTLLYFLFFCSGVSALIYQVVWVRVFGNVFGNTVYSASLVIAVFMLGLGVGSFAAGKWADRRYASQPESLLRAYGYVELLIAGLGVGISSFLPHLDALAALASWYSREPSGWYSLSALSYFARMAIATTLLTPITLLMGGTLTLLIRHMVRRDVSIGWQQIAALYAVNTAGAALGCFLTDFLLVPGWGLRGTQFIAAALNAVAGVGALWLASRSMAAPGKGAIASGRDRKARPSVHDTEEAAPAVAMTSLALAITGFAAMGMEILWFRHFAILLGEFRAVFSLLLTVILAGIVGGSLLGGSLCRYARRPAQWLMVVPGFFIASSLVGLAASDAKSIFALAAAANASRNAVSGWSRSLTDLWFNARPILLEVGIPALLMGLSFPLANALIQRAERSVGRRSGILYFANTAGAVLGSLGAGFLLLPRLGVQATATLLMITSGLAVVPLYFATRTHVPGERTLDRAATVGLAGSLAAALSVSGWWLLLPADYILSRALGHQSADQRLLAVSEGVNEVVAISETPDGARALLTNGHPMSSTKPLAQRYMSALAHVPLLCIANPRAALVIGFGVGNTTRAATLHPSIRRVEVADLSRNVLSHAGYFRDINKDVLEDPRVAVYVNDGRHHLQMQPEASYDLITLEPPPIAYAGVAALYSREFYTLARSRLTPKGYVSQWLPTYQVPAETTLAMIRAFLDVFPQAVLISGVEVDLLLLGVNDSRIEIDPDLVQARLEAAPAVRADLQRLDLGTVREIVGTFVASPGKLAEATRGAAAATDDRPIQEYALKSLLKSPDASAPQVVDLSQVASWCPKCFHDGSPVPAVKGLDVYLSLLDLAYRASPAEVERARQLSDQGPRLVAGSAYLGRIVPESAEMHNVLGLALSSDERVDEAIAEFRKALKLGPDSAKTRWNLGSALASRGSFEEAIVHLRRAAQMDPEDGRAHYVLARALLGTRQLDEAVDQFHAALRLMPDSVTTHNDLGVALALQGKSEEAVQQFRQALLLDPGHADARRNLNALRQDRPQ